MIRMSLPKRALAAASVDADARVHREMPLSIVAETDLKDWRKVCALEAIPRLGARVVKSAQGNIAVFRTGEDEIFALADKCPHKGGPLSQGIVFGRKVACPLHGWNIELDDGNAVAPDQGCTRSFPVRIEDGMVFLQVAGLIFARCDSQNETN
jgi:nitrite reductase (NADH) small subunit